MYRYTLTSYLKKKLHDHLYKHPRGYLDFEYTKEIYPEGDYLQRNALSWFGDTTFYSTKQLRQVPACNGILLPVKFFEETKL